MEKLEQQNIVSPPENLIDSDFFCYIEGDDHKEIQESLAILSNFCYTGQKALSKEAYTASILLPTFTKSENMPYSKYIKEAFSEINKKYSPKDAEYIKRLLNSQHNISNVWQEYGQEISNGQIMRNGEIDWDLTYSKFLNRKQIIEPEQLAGLMSEIDPEALLISAAEHCAKLEKLMTPEENENKNEVIDMICKAEALYSPILELMGYDAFNMELSSAAKQARLRRSGTLGQKSVEAARTLIDRDYENNKVNQGVIDTVSILLGENDLEMIPNDNDSRIWMAVGLCKIANGYEADFVARRKSRGSLAWKIYSQAKSKHFNAEDLSLEGVVRENMPVDIVGLQVILDDEDSLAETFQMIFENASERSEISPVIAPSREAPIHIRGSDNFISKILDKLNLSSPDGIDIRPEAPGGMEIAKITFSYSNMLFELALVTAEKRTSMRISPEIAHVMYKSGLKLNQEDLGRVGKFFMEINALKDKIGNNRISKTDIGKETLS